MSARHPESFDLPVVLVATPRQDDTRILAQAVSELGLRHEAIEAIGDLPEEATFDPYGAVILTQEVLGADSLARITNIISQQEEWSEIPVILLSANPEDRSVLLDYVRKPWHRAKLLVMSRPIGGVEFQTALQVAISNRLRQFHIRDQIETERQLRRELNHRVKNLITTVQAIAMMTRRTVTRNEDGFAKFQDRLRALGDVHTMLIEVGDRGVAAPDLFQYVLRPYGDYTGISVDVADLVLSPDAAHTMALCLHELLTNSVKYGALSGGPGTIDIALRVEGPEALFAWEENTGHAIARPEVVGYGTRFLTSTLGALFGVRPEIAYSGERLSLNLRTDLENLIDRRFSGNQ